MRAITLNSAGLLCALALAQRLDKPPLENNLDYLQQGLLDNLHPVQSTQTKWPTGWIPADCKAMTELAGLSASDVETFNVTYIDCNDPWILCRHKDSPDPLVNMIDLFGRTPVQARQWVRHMIALPDPNNGHAYNSGGNIAMFNRINGDMTVFIHETGHSLDFLGAYDDKPLSTSANWLQNYAQDTNVPDPYAGTNQAENVAQNTVVACFNEVVPGGFGTVEKDWGKVFHQFATVQTEAVNAGNLLVPGGTCTRRLQNSPAVPLAPSSRVAAQLVMKGSMPSVGLSDSVEIIEPKEFDTRQSCQHKW